MKLRVSVVLALRSRQVVIELDLPGGATVADALAAARLGERIPGVDPSSLAVGVWSRACDPATPLRDGDRVELYRPLVADARARRRARAGLTTSSSRSRSAR